MNIAYTKIIVQDTPNPFWNEKAKKEWYKPAKNIMNNLDKQGIAGAYSYLKKDKIKLLAWAEEEKHVAYLEKRGWVKI